MKRKKFSRRLVLNKKTLVNLNQDGLKAARGGETLPGICANTQTCKLGTCFGMDTCDGFFTCNGAHTCPPCTA